VPNYQASTKHPKYWHYNEVSDQCLLYSQGKESLDILDINLDDIITGDMVIRAIKLMMSPQ
jgi:hypothetical protein